MGAVDDETAYFVEKYGDKVYLVIGLCRGDPAHYSGISIEIPTAAAAWSIPAAAVAAAFDSTTALGTLIQSHAAPSDGPFAGVSGSTWWATLDATKKGRVRDHIVWAATRRPPL